MVLRLAWAWDLKAAQDLGDLNFDLTAPVLSSVVQSSLFLAGGPCNTSPSAGCMAHNPREQMQLGSEAMYFASEMFNPLPASLIRSEAMAAATWDASRQIPSFAETC